MIPDLCSPRFSKPTVSRLANAADWSLSWISCTAGPENEAFEEQHSDPTIACVLQGTFTYRTEQGSSLMAPGAILLGNPGACFECGHEHSWGDQCLSLSVSTSLFEEIAAVIAGSSRFRFAVPFLPANSIAPAFAQLGARFRDAVEDLPDELIIELIEQIIAASARLSPAPQKVTAGDERRVSRALRLAEARSYRDIDLTELAEAACLSKYHFLRVFRRTTGVTPHQYLLAQRLQIAASYLLQTDDPVGKIALDHGFNDLSTFNRHFRRAYGKSPGAFRG